MAGCIPLTDPEIDSLLAASSPQDRALFCLGIRTGFRISELLSITWKQLIDDTGTPLKSVEVPRRMVKGKTASRRVPLHEQAKKYIIEWHCISKPKDPSAKAFPMHRSTAHRKFKKALKAAGVDMSKGRLGTHALRKSFARKMYKALDNDLFKLQKVMGHSSVSITCKYLNVDQDELEEAIKGVD